MSGGQRLNKQTRDTKRLTTQIIGAALVAVGLYGLGQPENSMLILGVVIGPFLLIAPDMFL
jgi:uncharacterized membrane protein HdeD (DUF308 family)